MSRLTQPTTELPPELSALEAALSEIRPAISSIPCERAKAVALLELCRQASPPKSPNAPQLVELILDAGEQRISHSLRQHVRAERYRAGTVGIVLGLIIGALLNALSMAMMMVMLK